jgi:hypothetical protein
MVSRAFDRFDDRFCGKDGLKDGTPKGAKISF